MRRKNNENVQKGTIWDITQCEVEAHNKKEDNKVIQTPLGVLICDPNSHLTIFKPDKFQVIHILVKNRTKPIFISAKDAGAVLVDTKHYSLNYDVLVFNISYIYVNHNNPKGDEYY